MIKLDRNLVRSPASWPAAVAKALHDVGTYELAANDFERMDLGSHGRRSGFASYAPHCLRTRKGKPYFPSIWGKAKEALARMTNDKCSYCEGGINSARSGQVEHFKPKSLFPSLAYDWNNYFLACGGCNGAKGDQWPVHGGYLRPDEGDPTSELHFKIDGTIAANKLALEADVTIKHFDLNRTWLVRRRKKHLQDTLSRLEDIAKVYQLDAALAASLAGNELARLKDPANVYSAALTQCFLREWESACPGVHL